MQTFRKDPDAVLDYAIDWSGWLAEGETITDSDWTVPAGLTQGDTSAAAGVNVVWLSGGAAGASYTVTNRVTTSQGRTDDRSIYLQVRER